MNITQYWSAVLRQDADAIHAYFAPSAWINWHNTNEHFTVDEFIRVNCEYPGKWNGEIEKMLRTDDQIVTATHVYTRDNMFHFHVTSFFRIADHKIVSIDEYWGDDGNAPQWRQEMHIGCSIK